jgi:hypothetical protein
MKVFGREPAVWLALLAAGLQALTAFGLDVSSNWQSIITAVVAAVFGLITAFVVGDGVVAAVTGLGQAVLALVVGLGVDWSADDQAKLMVFVALVAGAFVRQNVVAPVPATAVSGPVKRA